MKELNDKVVWITGATSGIGAALVHEFCAAGAKIIISARQADKLEDLRLKLGKQVQTLPLDVSTTNQILPAYETARGLFGEIDILVNNAGISQRSLVRETELQVDQHIMQVNYFGNIALTKAVLPSMIKRKSGSIVVISSLAGKLSTAWRSSYSASKHALHGFYDALRAEVAEDGIEVVVVCPGYIKTNISMNALTAKGEPYGIMDDNQATGMSAEACARKILRAIRKGKKEFYVGGFETKFVLVRRLFPGLYFRIINRMARREKL